VSLQPQTIEWLKYLTEPSLEQRFDQARIRMASANMQRMARFTDRQG
jgi:hypothetical protein